MIDPLSLGHSSQLAPERPPTVEELPREFPDVTLPVLNVGTIFVSDGSVAVSGTVSSELAGTAELLINGHAVQISELGSFCAVVGLQGQSTLNLSLRTTHRRVRLEVPLRAF